MIPGINQLFSPLKYLRIRRKTIKPWYDWYIPIGLAVLSVLSVGTINPDVAIFGEAGVIYQATELLKMLIGFYIASLAAIATFPSANLDSPLDGEPTTLTDLRKGKERPISLSRRRFLSYLFGYLAFMSLTIFMSGTLAQMLADPIRNHLVSNFLLHTLVKISGVSFFLFWVFNVLVGTLLGLHYLTERIHRPVSGNVKKP